MSVSLGKVVDSGLVFYYDTSNPKSYLGEPSTNVLIDSLSMIKGGGVWQGYCGNESIVTNYTTDVLAPDGTFTALKIARNSGSDCDWAHGCLGWLHGTSNILTSGQTYTVSFWARSASGSIALIYGLNDGHGGGATVTPSWQRFTYTAAATNLDRGMQALTYATYVTFYLWGAQCERKGHATQILKTGTVSGSRTNTTGLLDLARNRTISLISSSFDSNANLTFDGSTSFIDLGVDSSGLGSLTNSITIEAIIKTPYPTNRMTIYSTGYSDTGIVFGTSANTPGGLEVYYPSVYVAYSSGSVIPTNTFCRVAYTRSGTGSGTHRFYLNGSLLGLALDGAQDFGTTSVNKYIGYRSGVVFTGEIPVVCIYNRALSQTEILNNYYRTKSRYGM